MIARHVHDGIEVTRSDGAGFTLQGFKARELGLSAGSWEVIKAGPGESCIHIRRSEVGERVGLWLGEPDTGELIKALCWDLFSSTTGVQLQPGETGKFRLKRI